MVCVCVCMCVCVCVCVCVINVLLCGYCTGWPNPPYSLTHVALTPTSTSESIILFQWQAPLYTAGLNTTLLYYNIWLSADSYSTITSTTEYQHNVAYKFALKSGINNHTWRVQIVDSKNYSISEWSANESFSGDRLINYRELHRKLVFF